MSGSYVWRQRNEHNKQLWNQKIYAWTRWQTCLQIISDSSLMTVDLSPLCLHPCGPRPSAPPSVWTWALRTRCPRIGLTVGWWVENPGVGNLKNHQEEYEDMYLCKWCKNIKMCMKMMPNKLIVSRLGCYWEYKKCISTSMWIFIYFWFFILNFLLSTQTLEF